MSGKQFIDVLKTIDYPDVNKLEPQDCDWMFDSEARPFLDWFCSNISEANVIHPEEIEEFKRSEQTEGVLEGRQLDEALNIYETDSEEENEETIKEELTKLNKDIEVYKKRKKVLLSRRNKISLHQNKLAKKLAKLNEVEVDVKRGYRSAQEQCEQDNTKMNESLSQLTSSVDQLNVIYNPNQCDSVDGMMLDSVSKHRPTFLYQVPLDDYYQAEEKFTAELTKFTKKQFFEGISEMAGADEGSRYELLNISDPDSLLIRGEKEEISQMTKDELARLQTVYRKSEINLINAKADSRRSTAAVREAKHIMEQMKSGHFGKTTQQLSASLSDVQTSLALIRQELTKLTEREIPALVKENSFCQLSRVLTGDYNLKIARQDYFTSKQDQVIEQLIKQRARNEFLMMAFEIEAKNHRDTHRLLTAIKTQLSNHLNSFLNRMEMMKDPAFDPARHKRHTIDSRDKSTMRLHDVLVSGDDEGSKQLYLSFSSLKSAAENLSQQVEAAEEKLFQQQERQYDKLKTMEKCIKMCKSKVYESSSTTTGQPLLIPVQIRDAMVNLEKSEKELEHTIVEITKDRTAKQKMLQNDPLLAKQREIVYDFFNDPPKVKTALDNLQARLNSLRIS